MNPQRLDWFKTFGAATKIMFHTVYTVVFLSAALDYVMFGFSGKMETNQILL